MSDAPTRSKPSPGLLLPAAVVVALALGFAGGRLSVPRSSPGAGAIEWLRDRPADGSPVLAEVDGKTITLNQFRERWDALTAETQRFHLQRGGPEHYLEELAEELLLAEEAVDRGLDEDPAVLAALRREANRVLSRPLLAKEVREQAVTERELRARFELRRDEWSRPARVRVREIRTDPQPNPPGQEAADDAVGAEAAEAKIRRLADRLAAGEDFAALAEEQSEAPSARYGGLIGWVVEGRFVLPYEEQALSLQPGETSGPIALDDGGWVLLRAEEREEASGAAFEDKREELLQGLLEEDPGALSRRYRVFVEQLEREHDFRVDPEALREAFSSDSAR